MFDLPQISFLEGTLTCRTYTKAIAVALTGIALAAASQAWSETTTLRKLIPGNELHRTVRGEIGSRKEVWKFLVSGAVQASYEEKEENSPNEFTVTGTENGIWAIKGKILCLAWSRNNSILVGKACYSLAYKKGNTWVARNVANGKTFVATLSRN